jgi:hypothetical protein
MSPPVKARGYAHALGRVLAHPLLLGQLLQARERRLGHLDPALSYFPFRASVVL